MSRHTLCHHLAILDALTANGALSRPRLALLLRRWPGNVRRDLITLEHDGRIVSQVRYDANGWPRRLVYRIATPEERATRLRTEERIRQALRSRTDGIEL